MWLRRPFRRRDTRALAIFPGGLAASCVFLFAAGTPGWRPLPQLLGACVAWCLVCALVIRLRRHLPPDMELVPMSVAEAERRQAPDTTLLHVRVDPEPLRRGRLDILIDEKPAAQLPPGTACILFLPRGQHTLTFMLFSRRIRASVSITALSGARCGYRIRVFGTRPPELFVTPEPSLPAETRLVRCVSAT